MSKPAGLPELTESFEEVERMVMETPRGRWFLAEFARRQRATELASVLESVQRLERAMNWKEAASTTDDLASRITQAIEKPAEAPEADTPLEARHRKYFQKDEEIFETAPAPRAVETPAPAEAEKKGAKLTVHRACAPEEASKSENPAAGEAPKRRIVIIRHKAGEEMEVPLQNAFAAAS